MEEHKLKTWRKEFDAVLRGAKKFDIRKEDDRKFEVGDVLLFREYLPHRVRTKYTGRELKVKVTYIVRGPEWDIPAGMVVMSICRIGANDE